MKELKIKIPKGFMVESFNKETGEIKFKEVPTSIIERIKTVDDLLKADGISLEDFNNSCEDLERDERAYLLLKLLVRILNEGWTPNWNDSSEYKYEPWFNMSDGSSASGFSFYDFDRWRANSIVGSRLCFKSSDAVEYITKQFIELYREYFTN